jgi:hypothetical protein
MGIREEYAAREQASWAALLAQFGRLSPEQQVLEGVVPGWSARDLLWHCARWAEEAAGHLEQMRAGNFVDPFEADESLGDRMNEEITAQARTMTVAEVLEASEAFRAKVRAVWPTVEPDEQAAEWYAEETFDHYDEHAAEFAAFADAIEA